MSYVHFLNVVVLFYFWQDVAVMGVHVNSYATSYMMACMSVTALKDMN